MKTAARAAIERPHQRDHEASLDARMQKGVMPKGLNRLLAWYSQGWDMEVPTALHKSEVWRDHGIDAQGGSKLGAPAHSDPFRRYLENADAECDQDGYYMRPMHAALSRLGHRWPLTARALFAVAQSGYDWRGVATRGGWAEEMFCLFLERGLEKLFAEYREDVVRLS